MKVFATRHIYRVF